MKAERRGLFIVVAVLVVSAVLGAVYGPNVRATTASADDYQSAVLDFTKVLDVVQANYAEPVDIDKAVYQGAIPGMLRMLDPHSNFFDARQFALLREDQRGKYYGVGMVVAPRENHTVVMSPYVGAPAYNAGIRPGDVIMKVDDKTTDGLTTSDVADMLKGAKGTIVKITVTREGYSRLCKSRTVVTRTKADGCVSGGSFGRTSSRGGPVGRGEGTVAPGSSSFCRRDA